MRAAIELIRGCLHRGDFYATGHSVFVGFAIGTGASALSVAHETGLNFGSSTDIDSIGGRSNTGSSAGTHATDLDVTNFAKASPGIEFTPSANVGTWRFKVLVFGFTA